ncbi:MAG TPA: TIGR01777 family oxidoreductase [Gemmataceae bacterium]|nr:TIGR01777 family oxidoreductase [Gemmataceae bacterium]
MRVFVTGGTGLIGNRVIRRLRERGDEVKLLTRRAGAVRDKFAGCTLVEGDPMVAGPWMDALGDCDAVVNLAGENIFGRRWSEDFKRLLLESRVKSTENVAAALARQPRTEAGATKVLVNASAVGYYGPHGDEELDESSPPGNDYLAQVCVAWEKSALVAQAAGVRVALVRIGVVLDKEGGALSALLTPFKVGAGGPAGSGRQWMPWIHHADLVGLILLGLDRAEAQGPINGTAPNPVTNKEFGKALGRALHRPAFLPTPGFVLRLGLGEVAGVILTGQRVLPRQALKVGYLFQYPTIDGAFADIFK